MKKYKIDDLKMENIATYMNDKVREEINLKEAPCSNEHFLIKYYEKLKKDNHKTKSEFYDLLLNEFNIDVEEL